MAFNMFKEVFFHRKCCGGYKLIFMDIHMPIMNGFETSKKIKEFCKKHNTRVKFIITSARIDKYQRIDNSFMDKKYIDGFLDKSISKDNLGDCLRKFYDEKVTEKSSDEYDYM